MRQALSYAFDRKSYLKNFWYGYARQSAGPFVKEMPAYLPGADSAYKFDLKKADALLKQAGFSKSNPLKMEILSIVGYPTLKAMAVLLQANLNKLGHKVTITELDISPWIDRIASHPDFDITVDNYNTVPEDPAGMFNSDNLAPAEQHQPVESARLRGARRQGGERAEPGEAERALPAAAEADPATSSR